MKNVDGKPEFCPSCPNKGSVVGELSPDRERRSYRSHYGGPTFADVRGIGFVFIDKDGFSSRAVVYGMEGRFFQKQSDGKLDIATETTEIVTDNVVPHQLLGRICLCNGASQQGEVECPAFNSEVFTTLVDRVIQALPEQPKSDNRL